MFLHQGRRGSSEEFRQILTLGSHAARTKKTRTQGIVSLWWYQKLFAWTPEFRLLKNLCSVQVLLFSQMTKMLDILMDYCYLRSYEFSRLDGSMAYAEREENVGDKFTGSWFV